MYISELYLDALLEMAPSEKDWAEAEPHLKKHGVSRQKAEGMLKDYHKAGPLKKAAMRTGLHAAIGHEAMSKISKFL